MKPAFRCLAIIAGGLATLFAIVIAVLLTAGEWLSTPDQPAAADALVVLAGDMTRALYTAELYSRGLAPVVYVSRPAHTHGQKLLGALGISFPAQEQLYRDILITKGVPRDRIRVMGNSLLSTVDEAIAARNLEEAHRRTLLVVTSPYHVRRVKLVFGDALPETHLIVVANPHEPYPKRWWTNQDVARNVVLETLKIAYYLVGGRFTSTDRHAGAR